MKKTLILFLSLFLVAFLSAKDAPMDLSFLRQDPNIKIYMEYQNATLDGITHEHLDSIVKANSDTIYARFIHEMTKKSSGTGLNYGLFENARYFLHVQILSVDEDGALKSTVSVIDMQTISQLTSFKVKAHGGVSGPFEELLQEAVGRLGENIADYVNEHMK